MTKCNQQTHLLSLSTNIPFYEARQLVEQRNKCSTTRGKTSGNRTGVTHAHAWVQTQSASTQTDLDSKIPVAVANVVPRKAQNSCDAQTETNTEPSSNQTNNNKTILQQKTNKLIQTSIQNNRQQMCQRVKRPSELIQSIWCPLRR
jgi:hypothetical protein